MDRKKLNIRCILFLALAVLWMGVIFYFSAQTADVSTEQSNSIGFAIGRFFHEDFDQWSYEDRLAYADAIEYPVRKCAHATEYAVLSFLFLGVFIKSAEGMEKKHFWKLTWRRALLAWACTTIYAATDEIHQLFVPGRSGQVTDVCIDSAGAGVGALAGMLIAWIVVCCLKRGNKS